MAELGRDVNSGGDETGDHALTITWVQVDRTNPLAQYGGVPTSCRCIKGGRADAVIGSEAEHHHLSDSLLMET